MELKVQNCLNLIVIHMFHNFSRFLNRLVFPWLSCVRGQKSQLGFTCPGTGELSVTFTFPALFASPFSLSLWFLAKEECQPRVRSLVSGHRIVSQDYGSHLKFVADHYINTSTRSHCLRGG